MPVLKDETIIQNIKDCGQSLIDNAEKIVRDFDEICENTITEEEKEMKYELKIEGMMCMHCQRHMTEALNKMEGVQAEINLEEKTAYVTADREISMDEFQAVVDEAGYTLVR